MLTAIAPNPINANIDRKINGQIFDFSDPSRKIRKRKSQTSPFQMTEKNVIPMKLVRRDVLVVSSVTELSRDAGFSTNATLGDCESSFFRSAKTIPPAPKSTKTRGINPNSSDQPRSVLSTAMTGSRGLTYAVVI